MTNAEDATPALVLDGISKTFGPVRALSDVGFHVGRGRIHALLGGNGSGKSTLIKILAGVHQADPGGVITVDGTPWAAGHASPDRARSGGLRFVHQDPGLFPSLSVADNIALTSRYPTRFAAVDDRALRRRASALLEKFHIDAGAGQLLGELRPADQTMVAIARALERREGEPTSLLVLDEPTASLPEEEVEVLLTALRRQARSGQGIVYVSHRIDEVLDVADDVTVLRDGRHVMTRAIAGLGARDLTTAIAGREVSALFGSRPTDPATGEHVLRVRGLRGGPLRDVSLDLRAGEVLGVAGLLGSGRSELLRILFGADPGAADEVTVAGVSTALPSRPAQAMALGVALVPEHRAKEAAFAAMDVTSNVTVARLEAHRRWGRLRRSSERRASRAAISTYGIRPGRGDAIFSTLSGGNQQKVVLARWLQRDPRVLLLDEPTQGVDVGARSDIYAAIREAADRGLGVVLVSSDFDELLHAADRIVVLTQGRLTADFSARETSRSDLTAMTYSAPQGERPRAR